MLQQAVELGSIRGLETLSIGALAQATGLTRSGVMGHFASKQDLQLAAVDAASAIFRHEVWEPVAGEAPGIVRLRAAMAAWLSYLERGVFPGGCFLSAASLEFDDRPGPVRDAVAAALRRWLQVLAADVATAQDAGALDQDDAPEQLAFELQAHVMACNWALRLFDDPQALVMARRAIERRIGPLGATAR